MKDRKSVTMKQIAAEAGVTQATVSLVLNKSPLISEETRTKVNEIAARLGYRRNPYISALVTSRRKGSGKRASSRKPVLAFCTNSDESETGERFTSFLPVVVDSAAHRASEKGYRLDRFGLSAESMSGRRLMEILYTRNISGILLFAVPELRIPAEVDLSRFSVVSLGFGIGAPVIDRVACDYFDAMMSAMEQCFRRNYRKIGLALCDEDNSRVNRRWLSAYLVRQREGQGTESIPPLLLDRWTDSAFFRWFREVRPDVIISPWSEFLQEKLRKHGWSVPGDVGLVSLDNPAPDGEISGVFQNPGLFAAQAVDMLVGSIEKNERGLPRFPNTLFMAGTWSPGTTLGGSAAGVPGEEPNTNHDLPGDPVSMRDVARQLGVHVSTVSLSLNDSPRVSDATKRRVRDAAAGIGFRRNPYVSTLMKARRSGRLPASKPRLAFITAFPTPEGWRSQVPTIVYYFRGARTRAAERGFILEEEWLSPEGENQRDTSDKLRSRSVHGLLFAPVPYPSPHFPLEWREFCLVTFGFTLGNPRIHRVCNDHYSSMRRAIRRCYALGYRRIGLAMSARANRNTQKRWLAAYLVQQHELKDMIPLKPLIMQEWGNRELSEWMKRSCPDVIITPNRRPLLERLATLGVAIPGDVGVCSLSCPDPNGSLTGIHQNPDLLGSRATDMLINLIERNEYGVPAHPRTLMVDGLWVPGETAPPR